MCFSIAGAGVRRAHHRGAGAWDGCGWRDVSIYFRDPDGNLIEVATPVIGF
jgi:catechol 2,3-dioxygenase-like lactoylglutathione lyase family enzyme